MSNLLNELLGKVSALTQTVNQIISGSKSIPELPAQTTLDGSSFIHASRGGTSEKISVQQIVNAAANNDNDQLLSVGPITLDDNDLTISSISGKINNVVRSIPTPTIVNIPYCATGLSRVDLIVYNNTNTIVRIAGTETAGTIIVAPTLPLDTLLVTQISVSDSAIGDPSSPILGSSYIKKEYSKSVDFNGTGSNVVIPLSPNGYSEIRLINSGLVSISGVDLSLMTGPNFESPYQGKEIMFFNLTGVDVLLKYNDFATAEIPFNFIGGVDVVFPANEKITFKYDATDGLYDIFKSWVVTAQATIVANTTLSEIHNNKIVKIKSNATITIPTGLSKDFNCVFRCFVGATATFVGAGGVTMDAQTGLILEPYKMATLFKDGASETYILTGETST